MKKIVLLLTLVLMLLVAAPVQGQETLSRGEFVAMLVEAGNMESNLLPADLLLQKGIMKGYPDGQLHLERDITRMEAAALTARTLGMAETVALPMEVDVLLGEHCILFLVGIFRVDERQPGGCAYQRRGRRFSG